MRHDRHSYAEPDQVRTVHLDLALYLDFDEQVLTGTATHRLDWSGGDRLVLDTRELAAFLVRVGRVKLVVPVYRALAESGQAAFAREVFERAQPGYHPITIAAVERLL